MRRHFVALVAIALVIVGLALPRVGGWSQAQQATPGTADAGPGASPAASPAAGVAASPVGADCTGVDTWLAVTRPRIERQAAIDEESRTPPPDRLTLLAKYDQWSKELAQLAKDQAATPAPAIAATLNDELAKLFQTNADWLEKLLDAGQRDNLSDMVDAAQALDDAEVEFGKLRVRVDDLVRQCGLAT